MSTDATATIIKALGGNLSSGMCPCPLHKDRTASLHIEAGRKVPVVFKCHAGCSQDVLVAWFKSRGQ
jgi:putative DNA primase/helicase